MSTSRSTTSRATCAPSMSNSFGNLCITKPVDGSRCKHLPEAGRASSIYVIIPVMKRDNAEFAYRQNFAAESSTLTVQKDIDI